MLVMSARMSYTSSGAAAISMLARPVVAVVMRSSSLQAGFAGTGGTSTGASLHHDDHRGGCGTADQGSDVEPPVPSTLLVGGRAQSRSRGEPANRFRRPPRGRDRSRRHDVEVEFRATPVARGDLIGRYRRPTQSDERGQREKQSGNPLDYRPQRRLQRPAHQAHDNAGWLRLSGAWLHREGERRAQRSDHRDRLPE